MTQAGNAFDRLVADRSHGLAMSAIKEMSILSARVPDAASLAWGLPSFRTPDAIRAAVAEALESDPEIGRYALPGGLPALTEAAAREHERRTGLRVDPNRRLMISAGNMEGMQILFQAILDPGDEVIVTDPGFVSHIAQIRFSGGVPVYWKMDEGRDWQIDVDALPGLIGPRCKAIVLVNPSNPTGAILSEATLRAVARIARDHGLSQLGYMIFSLGLSNYSVSLFHLMNHAFFKALLFLSAGSVIHALSDEQDMRKMGGLVKILPITYIMILIGSLSLMGFPFLTGFYSKDALLELTYGVYQTKGLFSY